MKEHSYKVTYNGKDYWITTDEEISYQEASAYILRGLEKYGNKLISIKAHIDGEFIELDYKLTPPPKFDRIRRITGYLVGTLDRFNDGKAAEERERVKHSVQR